MAKTIKFDGKQYAFDPPSIYAPVHFDGNFVPDCWKEPDISFGDGKRYPITTIVVQIPQLWESGNGLTQESVAGGLARLIFKDIDELRITKPERVQDEIDKVTTFLSNELAEHDGRSKRGDVDGIHATIATRYKLLLDKFKDEVLKKYPDYDFTIPPSPMRVEIVLRKLKNAQSYDDVRRVMAGSFPDCKREEVSDIVSRLKAFDKKGIGGAFGDPEHPERSKQIFDWLDMWSAGSSLESEKMFYEVLSPYIPKESLDLLFGQLSEIKCGDLKRFWFDRYFQGNMTGKEFFELCSGVVPQRNGERGWSYDNFKKS